MAEVMSLEIKVVKVEGGDCRECAFCGSEVCVQINCDGCHYETE